MAQRRMIAKKITQNKKLAQLKSPWAKLMFTWMIPYTDDYGKLPGDVEMLKALIFPREHKTLRKIAELRDSLEEIGLIKIYEVEGSKYIQMLGFDEWQTLKSDRPKQKECPDIPSGNQMETKVFPKLSKVKLSKDKVSKDSKAGKPVLSKTLKDLLDNVYKQGFNIYALLGRFKKKSKVDLPEAVIEKVCNSYLKNHEKIQNDWAWFIIAVEKASREYHAEQSAKEGQEWKKQPVAQSIKDIMRGIK